MSGRLVGAITTEDIKNVQGRDEANSADLNWFTTTITNSKTARLAIQLFNILNIWKKVQKYEVQTITYAGTVVFDADGKSGHQEITLTGDVTSFSFTNMTTNDRIFLIIRQDATGGRTFAFSGVSNDTIVSVGTTANQITEVEIWYDGAAPRAASFRDLGV